MNTKEIWNALFMNEKTNTFFDGVFSIDTLKNIEVKPELIICNTDPSYLPGEHWVLFFFEKDSVDFYDSLGKDISYYGPEFSIFIKNFTNNFKQCVGRTQPYKSSLCGLYCLYYAYAKCIGKSMEEIVIEMSNSNLIIDFVKKHFLISQKNYNCCLLQNCVDL